MATHELWKLDPLMDGELVRRVYSRSWPTTCRGDFHPDEIIERLGSRDLRWWQRKLEGSPVRFAGGSHEGPAGFALAVIEEGVWDLTYIFCEPAAFGTGLAGVLHDAVIEELRPATDIIGSWILVGNTRSQRFFETRGWKRVGVQQPPWPTKSELFYRYELSL